MSLWIEFTAVILFVAISALAFCVSFVVFAWSLFNKKNTNWNKLLFSFLATLRLEAICILLLICIEQAIIGFSIVFSTIYPVLLMYFLIQVYTLPVYILFIVFSLCAIGYLYFVIVGIPKYFQVKTWINTLSFGKQTCQAKKVNI